MIIRTLIAAFALALMSTPALAAPLEAYGKLPSIEEVTISPSGHAVALIMTDGDKRAIIVKEPASGAITLQGFLGEYKIRGVQWAGDEHLVVVSSATVRAEHLTNSWREWFFASLVDVKAKTLKPMMQNSEADMSVILDFPIMRYREGKPMVFLQGLVFASVFDGGQSRTALFRVDLKTGKNRLVNPGVENTTDWVLNSSGDPIAQETYNSGSGSWVLKLKTAGGWRDAATVTAMTDRPYVVGLGRDDASVIYAQQDENKSWRWREARTDGRPPAEPTKALDLQGVLRAAHDGRMIGEYSLVGDDARYTFYNPEDERTWSAIAAAYPGDQVSLESWSSDRKKVVVLVDSPTEGPAYALVDVATRQAKWLGARYAGLKAGDIAPRKSINFKAADGRTLTGYLTTPIGRAPTGLPLVVLAHGGPQSRDTPGFDWWAQAIASRGYAVLQVNFRGSDGFGAELVEAGYGEWGRKMQTDLSDGVRHLTSQGVVDPKRVCITGGSYGGYAAMAGPTLDRGVYRCAVAVAGVSDLGRMIGEAAGANRAALRYWKRFMGAENASDPKLAQISPARIAGRADAPILLIHGKDDTVVPYEQSQIMAEALTAAGKPVEFVTMPGEDHWLSKGATRLQMLQATVAFLEKHNPPQ
jgi:dipeptidyl aminopeptidase/acylaminoacyl peptidase